MSSSETHFVWLSFGVAVFMPVIVYMITRHSLTKSTANTSTTSTTSYFSSYIPPIIAYLSATLVLQTLILFLWSNYKSEHNQPSLSIDSVFSTYQVSIGVLVMLGFVVSAAAIYSFTFSSIHHRYYNIKIILMAAFFVAIGLVTWITAFQMSVMLQKVKA